MSLAKRLASQAARAGRRSGKGGAIGVSFEMKRLFFDKPAVLRDIDRKERQALSRIGAFVRRRARTFVRQRKRPRKGKRGRKTLLSRPGQPPISWTKPGIRDILFHYDPREKNVVIGPLQFNQSEDVPGKLEHGGTSYIWESRYTDREMPWHTGKWSDGPVENRKRAIRIKPRPFMGPALEAEQQTILDAFAQT